MEVISCPGCIKKEYPLYLSNDKNFSDLCRIIPKTLKKFIIYDDKIEEIFPQLISSLKEKNTFLFPIEASEKNKSFSTLQKLCKKIYQLAPSRDDIFIIIGGGLVMNFGGLTASLIMRGMRFIYIPTTFTGQIDACIGSKLAVNFYGAKNWIGMYNDPLYCYINPYFLTSVISRKEFKSQLIEAIKLCIATDKKQFEHSLKILDRINEPKIMYEYIKKMILLKIKILKKDLKEENEGMCMLYGHTIGHSIEMLSKGKLNHGESVALGMLCAAKISYRIGLCNNNLVEAHQKIISKLGLKTKIPKYIKLKEIIKHLRYNKKNYNGSPRMVFLKEVGIIAKDDNNLYYRTAPNEILSDCIKSCF